MPTSYTSLIGLALPQTGELSGTWGDTVNDYITRYLDAAIAGAQTISGNQTAVTLSTTNGSSLVSVVSGSTGSAQYSIINCTGNPAGTLTITVPTASKVYLVINATSTSQSVVVKPASNPGITIASGRAALLAWNGSDFVRVATNDLTALIGTLSVASGGTGQTTYTNGQLLIGNTTGNTLTKATLTAGTGISITNGTGSISIAATNNGTVTSVGGTGTINGITLTGTVTSTGNLTLGGALSNVSLTSQVTGTLPVANGGTGVTTSTGTGANVLSTSPVLTTPNLGTPTALTLTSATGLPLTTGVTGTLPIANGGTGATTAANAFTALKQAATDTATGVVELATNAEAAAGSDTTRAITPATLFGGLNASGATPIYAARAWVNFDGTLASPIAPRASGNVSSVTKSAAGTYAVNFATSAPDANYAVIATCSNDGSGSNIPGSVSTNTGQTTSAVTLLIRDSSSGSVDRTLVYAAIFR